MCSYCCCCPVLVIILPVAIFEHETFKPLKTHKIPFITLFSGYLLFFFLNLARRIWCSIKVMMMWVISLSTGFVQVLENQENSGIWFYIKVKFGVMKKIDLSPGKVLEICLWNRVLINFWHSSLFQTSGM